MMQFDADKLTDALMELEPKRRMRAMKGAFRKAANKVSKQPVANLRQSGINTKTGLAKGIRSVVWKRKPGLRVTIGTKKANKKGKGESGFHINRREMKKSEEKRRKCLFCCGQREAPRIDTPRPRLVSSAARKKGHYTGRMKQYGFMDKTQAEMKDRITDELRQAMEDSIMKALKKYGKP